MKIAVDAGHGYDTVGKRSAPFTRKVAHTYDGHTITVKKGEQFREHVANAGVAFYLAKELERCKIEVFKSAWNDFDGTDDKQLGATAYSDVVARQRIIAAAGCDYCISIHFNAYGDGNSWNTAAGIETLYHTTASKVRDGRKMASYIQESIKDVYKQKNRGIVGGSGWGMCNAAALNVKAACIVELAFMTNQTEAENYFCNPEAWYRYAVAIAQGICNYTNVPYVEKQPDPVIYRIQVGAYSIKKYALAQQKKLIAAGFDAIVNKDGKLYKVQAGAYSNRKNAEAQLAKVRKAGFDAIIST